VPPSGTYNANFSDPSGWEWPRNGNYSEWEPSNGTLIYSNSGNTTSSRALSPADIRTPNYAIEAQVQVIFSDWGGCSQAGVFSRGMGFYDYSGGVVKFCGDTGEYFVISACQSECNNIAYSRADIEGVKITFRLEVRGTDLAFYIDGGKLFEGKANTSNKATRTGIFAHGIKSMQVYSFKVGAL